MGNATSNGGQAISALEHALQQAGQLGEAAQRSLKSLNGWPWQQILAIGLHSPLAHEFETVFTDIQQGLKTVIHLAGQVESKVSSLLQQAQKAGQAWLDGPGNVEQAQTGKGANGGWEPLAADLQGAVSEFHDSAAAATAAWTGTAADEFTAQAQGLYQALITGIQPISEMQDIYKRLADVETTLSQMQERLVTGSTKLVSDAVNVAIQTLNTAIQEVNVPQDLLTEAGTTALGGPPGAVVGACLDALQAEWATVAKAVGESQQAVRDVTTMIDNLTDESKAIATAIGGMSPPEASLIPQN